MCVCPFICVRVYMYVCVCVCISESLNVYQVLLCGGDARDSMAAICHTIPYPSGVNFPLHAFAARFILRVSVVILLI